MKKLILCIAAVAMLLPSCKKINEALDSLDGRLDKLEQEAIPSIDEQIAAINTSLDNLNVMDSELKGYIDGLTATASNLQEQINAINTKIEEVKTALQDEISTAKANVIAQLEAAKEELENELATINATIATLQAKDAELDGKITELQTYVDTELGKTTDWASATFATLEQYNALASEVATIKEQIKAINESITNLETKLTTKINEDIATAVSTLSADIQQKVSEITTAYTNAIKSAKEEITAAYTVAIQTAISNLDSSLKAWVGEQLANYYTIAQIDAKIEALQGLIQQNGSEELINELNSLKSSLQTMKAELTAAYKKAIEESINTNNGVINAKIASEITAVNNRINSEVAAINAKISAIESRLDDLEDKIEDLLNHKLEITFDNTDDIAILAGGSCKVNYTVTSSESEIHIATIAQNGWKASVTKSTEKTGYITVYAPNPLTTEPIIVLVSDTNTTIMRNITFVDGISNIATKSYILTSDATTLSIDVQTNLDYTVSIPSTASNWISLNNITTRAAVRNDVINLKIEENAAISSRKATLQLVCNDIEVGTISIYQQGVEVANNELIYTSSDKKIINPYQTMGFNANIVSNTYSNGRGLIVFDKDITAISEYAFYNCTKLTSIQMPKSITKIREYAFYGTALSEINIPSNATEIASYAFYSTNLTNLVIPDNVITIGDYTFYDCNLKNVIIGQGVTWIGARAFYLCGNLTSIYCKPTTPPAVYYTKYSGDGNYKDSLPDNSDMKIYVPRNSYDSYMRYSSSSSSSSSGCYVQNWYGYEKYIMAYDFE